MSKVNVKVEFEIPPIRHIAVQCPHCKKWFYGNDISEKWLTYEYQLDHTNFLCPICHESFGYDDNDEIEISEVPYPEIYKDCKEKKVTWV